ncbi:MAG: replication protein [Candidatus Omnitrophica bacterium]|nr:replication protein [Candidatus Omnitrophota bacterium]
MKKLSGIPVPFLFAMHDLRANPQVEDGYVQIANELMDAIISYPFKNSELKIVLTIIRKTYGWKKKKDRLSFSQISKLSRVSIRHTKRVIKNLVLDNVILKEKIANNNILGLNKDYYSWSLWKTLNPGDRIVTGKVSDSALQR